MGARWEFWIDRGGTFTDCIGRDLVTGALSVAKVPSTPNAPIAGIRRVLGLGPGDVVPPIDVRVGTTVATNALLARDGVPCALVTTSGFGDALEIGTQARPRLFDLDIVKPEPLYREVVEIDARAAPDGSTLRSPSHADVTAALAPLLANGTRSLAVVLLHAHASDELETLVGGWARTMGFSHVALSSEVSPELGLVARGSTTVLDAYLTPLLREHVTSLERELPGSTIRFMQSSGGLSRGSRFRGQNAILSGPAGGLVAVGHVARSLGETSVVGLDMGGTSTDVSRYAGELPLVYETEAAGVRVRAPTLDIVTVAAGGGSICRFDGTKLAVGPQSAGAEPGPLCYGNPRSAEVTLTDVNVVLGRLVGDRFPFPLHEARSARGLSELRARLGEAAGGRSVEAIAEGFFDVANDTMAEAIRRVSIARGHDVRGDALVVFGGAGGQHACAVARRLGIRRVIVHPLAGVLSAFGMGLADVTWDGEAPAGERVLSAESMQQLAPAFDRLEAEGRRVLRAEGFSADELVVRRRVDLRHAGTEVPVTLSLHEHGDVRDRFDQAHEVRFGYRRPLHPVEITVARVTLSARRTPPALPSRATPGGAPRRTARLYTEGAFHDVPVWDDPALPTPGRLKGPLIVTQAAGTVVVDPGFALDIRPDGVMCLVDDLDANRAVAAAPADLARADPVLLAITSNAFLSIAEQMGESLRRTAISTNIRERLDFSCAIFDATGGLVANAPHIPVHLGAMSESVRAVLAAHPHAAPGDVFVTNDPALGGSHLPDVTVVSPAHDETGRLLFFTASRGHHADIGGITPGSMPPFSASLADEGIVFRAERVVHGGVFDRAGVLERLTSGPYPARRPTENVADLEAQIAANLTGARLAFDFARRLGLDTMLAYMAHVQDDGAAKARDFIASLGHGEYAFGDRLDDGTAVRVALRATGDRLEIDFSGTGPEVAGNLNAPPAVTVAAVLYVLRCLVGADIPLNGGCLRPVTIRVPPGTVLSPSAERAVAGGNVETSQRVVDVLLGALGRAAASQGTMNNLTFGDASFGYYETLAGGAGATAVRRGASAVHTHMTNTRITDPEVLEARYPVRVVAHAVRRGSGGAGRHRGGDGLVRAVEALVPLSASILSERRTTSPFGLRGGLPGAPGRNLVNGREIAGKVTLNLVAGDVLRIETPGGGGFGEPT